MAVPSSRRGWEVPWLGAIGLGLAGLWLAPYLVHGYRFPIGPDVPVYLWWAKLASAEGLSVVARRPGVQAVLLTLSGALHLPLVAVVGASLVVIAVVVAMAAAALARAGTAGRSPWIVAALLAGLYARFMVWGYLANLAFDALFLAAVAMIAARATRRRRPAAALLGAAGLMHPYFLALGAAVLALTYVAAMLRDDNADSRGPAREALVALVGGAAITAGGLLAAAVGPRVSLDYSFDAVLRHSGLNGRLPGTYRAQFESLARTDGAWLALEACFAILARLGGFVGRFLGAWAVVILGALPIGLATLLFAGQRLVFFALFLPILAGVGLVSLAARSPRRSLGALLVAAVVGSIAFHAGSWWGQTAPEIGDTERSTAVAMGMAIAATPAGTPVVVVVDQPGYATVLPMRALNIVRDEVLPDRIPDVFVYFGGWRDVVAGRPSDPDPVVHSLQEYFLRQIPRTETKSLVLVPSLFNSGSVDYPGLSRIAPGLFGSWIPPKGSVGEGGVLAEVPPAMFVLGSVLVMITLFAAGYGWARFAGADRFTTIALSPAIGLAALVSAGVLLERLGVPLAGTVGPTLVVVVATLSGYGVEWRRARSRDGRA